MLRRIHGAVDTAGAMVTVQEASFPVPFRGGLEYNSPAHGPWNIVHMGMLIPDSHQIYVCAPNCNRGVVLTAAEMNAIDRFSTIFLREHNLIDGNMEDFIVEGVSDILARLPKKPSCVLLFTVCIHHFLGTDIPLIYKRLRERFPELPFVECYMDPIKQKGDRSPDQFLRRAMCSVLEPQQQDGGVSLLGSDFPLPESCELVEMVRKSGRIVRQQPSCGSFSDYLDLSKSEWCLFTYPNAKWGMEETTKRLGTKGLYLPASFGYEEIARQLDTLAESLGCEKWDHEGAAARCEAALLAAKQVIGDTPIVIDHTYHPRTLGLARLLVEHGFRVERLYLDAFNGEERADFDALRTMAPKLEIYATIQPKMREMPREYGEKVLALGQKAAYFTGTDFFVNLVSGAGLWGYDGIIRTAELMVEAWQRPKEQREKLISRKGWGCERCI